MASGQGKDAGHWLDGLSGGESPPPFFHLISCEVLGPRSREVRAEFIRPLSLSAGFARALGTSRRS
jgi:hypothetical protein